MSERRSTARTFGLAFVALVVLVAAFSPMLLFGRGSSVFSFFLTSGGLLAVGLLLRRNGGADAHWIGTFLAAMGAALTIMFAVFAVLLIAGAFSGY